MFVEGCSLHLLSDEGYVLLCEFRDGLKGFSIIQNVICDEVDGTKNPMDLHDFLSKSIENCFDLLMSWFMTSLHEEETKEY